MAKGLPRVERIDQDQSTNFLKLILSNNSILPFVSAGFSSLPYGKNGTIDI